MSLATFQREQRLWPKFQLVFWGVIVYRVTEWFFDQDDISNAQGIVVASIYGAAAAYGKFYGETDPANKPIIQGKISD